MNAAAWYLNCWHGPGPTLAEAEKNVGAQHMAWIRAQPNPVATCEVRAAGAWQANDGESFAVYSALARFLAAGK